MKTINTTARTRQQLGGVTPPGVGEWALALVFLGISLGGAGGSLYINYTFGAQFGVIPAGIFTGGEIALFAIPFTKTGIGWNPRRRAFWFVALLLSLTAASFHIMQIFDERAKQVDAISSHVDSAKSNENAARGELARIKETQSVTALTALMKSANAILAEAENKAQNGGVQCIQQRTCRDAVAKRDALTARLGDAQRRDKLEEQLGRAQMTLSTTTEKSAMGAGTIARMLGMTEAEVSAKVVTWIMALSLIFLVMASGFSGDAGMMLSSCWERHKAAWGEESPMPPEDARMTWEAPKDAPAIPIYRKGVSKASASAPAPQRALATVAIPRTVEDQYLRELQTMVMQSGGRLAISVRSELAPRFRVPRATMGDWLDKWQAEGKIVYYRKGNHTVIELPRAA